MELNKKLIHMNHMIDKETVTFTIDDDFNVPDIKPDIVRKIKEKGCVIVEKIRPVEGRAGIGGHLHYKLLYSTGSSCACMEGDIPFEETVGMNGTTTQDIIRCQAKLEDITISVINSRKISVKAVVGLYVTAQSLYDREAVSQVQMDRVQLLKGKINVMQLVTSKKDIFRIRESCNLPSDRPNAGDIIWYEAELQNMDIRPCADSLEIKGELWIFCIYTGETDTEGLNYYDDIIPFSGKIDVSGCSEEMYPDVGMVISQKSFIVRPDANGEMRILDCEIILDLDINGYAEEETEIIKDIYSPAYDLKCNRENMVYDSLVIKNSAKCRLQERYHLPAAPSGILQIMCGSGTINMDETVIDENGIRLEGSVTADILYLKPDDDDKIGYVRYELPYSEMIDNPGLDSKCSVSCKPGTLQMTTVLTGGSEIDIKCNVGFDVIVTRENNDDIIEDIVAGEPDYEYMKNLPGITGYISRPGDTLWDIAKKHCTTIQGIMSSNNLASEEIQEGTRLLIIKGSMVNN